jgi:endonuclease YncB( thermonuclease family)
MQDDLGVTMVRRATVTRIEDGGTFIIRPNMAVKLMGVDVPPRGTSEAERAKGRLEELVLGRRVEFDVGEWDRLGRSIAAVRVDGVDVNEEMRRFTESLKKGED